MSLGAMVCSLEETLLRAIIAMDGRSPDMLRSALDDVRALGLDGLIAETALEAMESRLRDISR